ncbi:MAG: zf-HC2 domain-containing protein [Bacteroidota bacterium]
MRYNSTVSENDQNGKTDCLELLNLVLDSAASEEEKESFKEHLKQCMPCYEKYSLDMAIKKLIQEKCCGKHVPEGLVASIRAKVIHIAE